MRSVRRLLTAALLALGVLPVVSAEGAEIWLLPKVNPTAVALVGKIVPGDSARFREALAKYEGTPGRISGVLLNSPGGDIAEAMSIGRTVRDLLLETSAPALLKRSNAKLASACDPGIHRNGDCVCASACFVIFVSGIHRSGNNLLLHRLRFGDEARPAGLREHVASYGFAARVFQNYLAEMGVPRHHIDTIMRVRSDTVWKPEDDEIERFYQGWVPETEEWLIGNCSVLTEEERSRRFEVLHWRMQTEAERRADPTHSSEMRQMSEKMDRSDACIAESVERERAREWVSVFGSGKVDASSSKPEPLSPEELDRAATAVSRCWIVPARLEPEIELELDLTMNDDRTVQQAIVVDTGRMRADSVFRSVAESALRAVRNPACSPLKLPVDRPAAWKQFRLTLNTRTMLQ